MPALLAHVKPRLRRHGCQTPWASAQVIVGDSCLLPMPTALLFPLIHLAGGRNRAAQHRRFLCVQRPRAAVRTATHGASAGLNPACDGGRRVRNGAYISIRLSTPIEP